MGLKAQVQVPSRVWFNSEIAIIPIIVQCFSKTDSLRDAEELAESHYRGVSYPSDQQQHHVPSPPHARHR